MLQSIRLGGAGKRERSSSSRVRARSLSLALDLCLHFDALFADIIVLDFE